MHPLLRHEDDQESGLELTPARLFERSGSVERSNYRRKWVGYDYNIKCGKFKRQLLSQVSSEKWLLWALNQFEGQLEQTLYRALIDQLNSLHK